MFNHAQNKSGYETTIFYWGNFGVLLLAVGCSKNDDDFIGEELETPIKLAIQITETDAVLRFSDNETKTIHYTITGGSTNAVVKAEMQNTNGSYTLRTIPTSATAGTVTIQTKTPTENRVIVSAFAGGQAAQASIAVSGYSLSNGQTVRVETPGTLDQLLTGHNPATITELTVTGVINASDISILGGLPNLRALDIENTHLIVLPHYAFWGSANLISIKLPRTLITIEEFAFAGCTGLAGMTIPSSVTTIRSSAFSGCSSLTSVTIPSSVTTIRSSAFSDCSSLTSVTIPGSVTTIEISAFSGCSGLTSVTIPNSVTTIEGLAFWGCSSLTSVTIPNSVTTIKYGAFWNCSGLTQIECKSNTPPELDGDVFLFYGVPTSNCVLYVPTGCAEAYRTADGWKGYIFKDIIETEF